MKTSFEHTSSVAARLEVVVAAADYEAGLARRVRSTARKARLPGFRLGHVPPAHIERLYGKSLLLEELQELVASEVERYHKEHSLRTLGQPLLEEADPIAAPAARQDYRFVYSLGLQPEVSLKGLEKQQLTRYRILPEPKDIETLIENIRYRFGPTAHPERLEHTDTLLCLELQHNNKTESVTLPVADMHAEAQQSLMGFEVGTARALVLESLYAPNKQPAVLQRLAHEGLNCSRAHNCRLTRMDRPQMAPMDAALFEKMYAKNKITDEAAFRAHCNEQLQAQYETESSLQLKRELKDRLLADFAPELPTAYLRKRFKENIPADAPADADFRERAFAQYQQELAWRTILASVSSANNLEVSHDELTQEAERLFLRQAQVYAAPTDEQRKELTPFVQKFLSERKNVDNLYAQIQEEKVLNFLLTQVQLKEKKLTPTAFHDHMQTLATTRSAAAT